MGRTAIFMVMGFSTIFLLVGRNMQDVGTEALKNSIDYYEQTQLNTLASSGTNLACSKIFRSTIWRDGLSNISFNGGTVDVDVEELPFNQLKITTTATFVTYGKEKKQQAIVKLTPSSFSQFAYYGGTNASSAYWESGDTVGGPSHTQGVLRTTGGPAFLGRSTSLSGRTMINRPPNPVFEGGFDSPINIPMPTVSSYTSIYNAAVTDGYNKSTGNLYLKFEEENVLWKTNAADPWTTEALSTFAPNGIIAIDKGTLHVEGTVEGRVTLASIRTSGSTGGTINITNDLVLKTDPKTNPSSTDFLGVVSYSDITVKNNSATTFNMQGSYYSATGGLAVENYSTRPAGNLRLFGGMMVQKLYATSNGASGSSRRGYNLKTDFDYRLADVTNAPDYFPTTGGFRIISWLE